MTIIQKIISFAKKKYNSLTILDARGLRIQKFNPFIIIIFLVIFSGVFFISSNLINEKNKRNTNNLENISKSNEFSNFTNFLSSKINSPYEEISYVIKNNDTVEKILKKFKIKNEDIRNISAQLKQKKLANIYSGRKLSLIIKKLENGSNTIINLIYPITNTTSIEIRKSKNNFLVNENILQLYKKEVVIKNTIENNLYSSAMKSGLEPNIIVEFARIFGFEIDFQRDIRKGDSFRDRNDYFIYQNFLIFIYFGCKN